MEKFEEIAVTSLNVSCDGGGGALGHPKVYLQIVQETGFVVCPYCSLTYILKAGGTHRAAH